VPARGHPLSAAIHEPKLAHAEDLAPGRFVYFCGQNARAPL